jgi:L,D-peptidoglycan transpeptidase YkuD (ErfK/YbiS/YcfS/YnhG family)
VRGAGAALRPLALLSATLLAAVALTVAGPGRAEAAAVTTRATMGASRTLSPGTTVTITGRVSVPATGAGVAGAKVAFQRSYLGAWRTVQTAVTDSTGRAKLVLLAQRTNPWRLVWIGNARYGRAVSPTVTLRVPAPARVAALASGVRQALVVSSPSSASTRGTSWGWQRDPDGIWRLVMTGQPSYVGVRGWTTAPSEYVSATPVGVFTAGFVFGWSASGSGNPGSAGMGFRTARASSVWVSDPASSLYNTWQDTAANGRWDPARTERMRIAVYQIGVVINTNPGRVAPKGSAIFLHITNGAATAGCVATSRSTVMWVANWLDPAYSPRFVMGPSWWQAG